MKGVGPAGLGGVDGLACDGVGLVRFDEEVEGREGAEGARPSVEGLGVKSSIDEECEVEGVVAAGCEEPAIASEV